MNKLKDEGNTKAKGLGFFLFMLLSLCIYSDSPIGLITSAFAQEILVADALYVAPNGNDNNAGSINDPWKTVKHAVSQLSAGDTLYLRDGTYYEKDVVISTPGTLSDPVTIKNYPGEHPLIDGGYRKFRAVNNQDWELFDRSKEIYRSRKTFANGGPVYGYLGSEIVDGRLIPYAESQDDTNNDFGPFSTDEESFNPDYPYYYAGPGTYWNSRDQRIYVRLKASRYASIIGNGPSHGTNPTELSLILFGSGNTLSFTGDAKHIIFAGIDVKFQSTAIKIESGASHITVKNAEILGGQDHIIVGDQAHDLVFDNIFVIDRIPSWLERNAVKQPVQGRPAGKLDGAAIRVDGSGYNIEIKNSRIINTIDGMAMSGSPHDIHIHHNYFQGQRDDVLQIGTASYEIDFSHNEMIGVHNGLDLNESGQPPVHKIATKYLHHNVIDASVPMFYGREDPFFQYNKDYSGPAGDGMAGHRPIGQSASSIKTANPWKIYHNTMITLQDVLGGALGVAYVLSNLDAQNPHEVYNNIFIQSTDWILSKGADVGDGSQIWDGNLYYRKGPQSNPLFKNYTINGNNSRNFTSLDAFRASSHFLATQSYYAPGWESSGMELNPELDCNYVPAIDGPVVQAAIDLSDKAWPGLTGESFIGAMPPANVGSTSVGCSLASTASSNTTLTEQAPVTSASSGSSITSFTLVDANKNADIQTLGNGQSINLAALPTQNLSIRANTNSAVVGSVRFRFTGKRKHGFLDSAAPYALYGDKNGNYKGRKLTPGSYTITATPYSGARKSGTKGKALSMSFTVNGGTTSLKDTTPPSVPSDVSAIGTSLSEVSLSWGVSSDNVGVAGYHVYRDGNKIASVTGPTSYKDSNLTANTTYQYQVSAYDVAGNVSAKTGTVGGATKNGIEIHNFTLVNADSNTDIRNLSNGQSIDLTTLPTQNLNIRANTNPAVVGSVKFAFKGKNNFSVENRAPYALIGDENGNYRGWKPTPGSYTITATPYSGARKSGTQGTVLSMSFTVNRGTASPTDTTPPSAPTNVLANGISSSQVKLTWTASSDNVGVAGYHIYRNGNKITSVAATSYTDRNLTADTTYQYQLSAYDAAGNTSAKTGTTNGATHDTTQSSGGSGAKANEFACLSDATFIEKLTGLQNGKRWFYDLPNGSGLDLRGAFFESLTPDGDDWHPLQIRGGSSKDICIAGANIVGVRPLGIPWRHTYHKKQNHAAIRFENPGVRVHGAHIYNTWDGIRPTAQGAANWEIAHTWLEYIRDDCIENDQFHSGRVYDSFFDGCYVGYSNRPGNKNSANSGAGKTVAFEKSLFRMEPMPYPQDEDKKNLLWVDGVSYGHNGFFKKFSGKNPKFVVKDSIFLYQWNPRVQALSLTGIDVCSNNTVVWLGPGDFPGKLTPGCFKVTKDINVWKNAVRDWHARHPNVGDNRKKPISQQGDIYSYFPRS